MAGRLTRLNDSLFTATSASCLMTNGRRSVNFSLHSTTGPSSATLPQGAQDLPRLQRPARRRLSPGKVIAVGLAILLGVGGVVVFSVPGMSKPITGFFSPSKTDVITTVVHKGPLPITVVEK